MKICLMLIFKTVMTTMYLKISILSIRARGVNGNTPTSVTSIRDDLTSMGIPSSILGELPLLYFKEVK